MKRILIGSSGGVPSINFERSLRDAKEQYYLIGMDSHEYNIFRAEVDESHLITLAADPLYIPLLQELIERAKPDFLHTQNDYSELKKISDNRHKLNTLLFIPSDRTIKICIDKNASYREWSKAGLNVPHTILVKTEDDLLQAIKLHGTVWLRYKEGGFGYGSLHTGDFEFAKKWIDYFKGWGKFTAAEYLSEHSVTWMALYKEGELVVAQGRKRLYWEFASRTVSGVTGVTGTGVTVSDPVLDKIAQDAIYAIDKEPHGVFSVDLTYNSKGIPTPTEINIGRFFTTSYFYTKAGLNMAELYVKLAFGEKIPRIEKKINPLPEGLAWVRGMDVLPVLTTVKAIEAKKADLTRRIQNAQSLTGKK
ncbi:carboxylate--amine ligase [Candidatus Woesearchaeota archaeon]|nr:carboxylate--amine ligase [Candidatus Woesearchaeota archaeon]